MLETWEIFGQNLHNFKQELEGMIEMLPQSQKMYKKTTALNKAWKKVQRSANDMDQFITPVKSVKVVSPLLEDPEFPAAWKMWKEYLIEQHGIHLRSRAELMSLKRLADISEQQPKTAVRYLEFAMSRTDRNFYKVNETDIAQTSDEKPATKKVYKAPPRYSANQGTGANSSPHRGEVTSEQRGGGVKQKTLQEEIEDFKNSKKKKSKK